MLNEDILKTFKSQPRTISSAQTGDEELRPLQLLPGTWKSLPGRGWNMIALPFATEPESRLNYRLLINQYDEELKFTLVDKAVPNRGIQRNGATIDSDQFVAALDYEQMISQIAVEDSPKAVRLEHQVLRSTMNLVCGCIWRMNSQMAWILRDWLRFRTVILYWH